VRRHRALPVETAPLLADGTVAFAVPAHIVTATKPAGDTS